MNDSSDGVGGKSVSDRAPLQETIALLKATLDSTHDAILVVDLEQRIIFYNRRYLEMFGFTAEQLDRGGLDLVVERMRAGLQDEDLVKLTERELLGEQVEERRDVLRFKDGHVLRALCRAAPHRIAHDWPGSELPRHRPLGPHRRGARTASAVSGAGAGGCAHRQLGGRARRLGPAWLVGGNPSHLRRAARLIRWHGRRVLHLRSPRRTRDGAHGLDAPPSSTARRTTSFTASCEATARSAGCTSRPKILRDGAGRAMRMVGTVQDITARRQLEDQLRQSQKMEAIGRLAGGIAHDLNNALTAIAGYAELALNEVKSGHPARPDVEEIRRAAERAGSVTRQLLAFSRKQLLEPRMFDLNDTVTAIARLLSRLLGADIHVQTRLSEKALTVLGDPGQVEQAMINLAVNARDAMPNGGQLVLDDDGRGAWTRRSRAHPRADAARALCRARASATPATACRPKRRRASSSRSSRPRKSARAPASACRWSTARVKQIGGFIFVDSEIGRGTTFRLYFPPAVAAARGGARAGAPRRARDRNGDAAGRRGRAGGAEPGGVGAAARRLPAAARELGGGGAARSSTRTPGRSICC